MFKRKKDEFTDLDSITDSEGRREEALVSPSPSTTGSQTSVITVRKRTQLASSQDINTSDDVQTDIIEDDVTKSPAHSVSSLKINTRRKNDDCEVNNKDAEGTQVCVLNGSDAKSDPSLESRVNGSVGSGLNGYCEPRADMTNGHTDISASTDPVIGVTCIVKNENFPNDENKLYRKEGLVSEALTRDENLDYEANVKVS